ncbi:MAG: GGDEF domain-containing protein [Pseudomonadota bacterium]
MIVITNLKGKIEESSTKITLVDIDLNRFKPVNDVFGHATGDRALVATAQLLQDSIRLHDIAGRLGGDEFSVLLTSATSEEAKAVFDRLSSNFEQLLLPIDPTAKINISDKDLMKLKLPNDDPRNQKENWQVTDLSQEEYRKLGLDVRFTDQDEVFLSIDATLGMAIAKPGMTADELEANADENMYQNKSIAGWEHYSR